MLKNMFRIYRLMHFYWLTQSRLL